MSQKCNVEFCKKLNNNDIKVVALRYSEPYDDYRIEVWGSGDGELENMTISDAKDLGKAIIEAIEYVERFS